MQANIVEKLETNSSIRYSKRNSVKSRVARVARASYKRLQRAFELGRAMLLTTERINMGYFY